MSGQDLKKILLGDIKCIQISELNLMQIVFFSSTMKLNLHLNLFHLMCSNHVSCTLEEL